MAEDEFKDLVEGAVAEAQSVDGEDTPEVPEPSPVETDTAADDAAESAPVADDWKPPTRGEWEAAQRHAALGQQFAPYAREIDQILRERLSGGGQRREESVQQQIPAAPDSDLAEFDAFFASEKSYEDLLERINTDRKILPRIVELGARRVSAEQGKKLQALEKRLADQDAHIANLRAFNEVVAPRRFAETPDWKRAGKGYIDLLNGGLQDPNKAWELAHAQAIRQGATPTQAAQAGERAAERVETQNATKGAQKSPAPKRPLPAQDRTSGVPARKPTSKTDDTPTFRKEERDGNWERALVRGALQKLGKL